MIFPQEVLDIVKEAAVKYPDDIQRAVDKACGEMERMPDYKSVVDDLIRSAIQNLIYEYRHASDVQIRRQVGGYSAPAKIDHSSEEVAEVYRSVYDYFIAGRTLGNLLGEELKPIAENEENKAKGHTFNAVLCRNLSKVVKEKQLVKQAVTEKQLRNLFKKSQDEVFKK